MKPKKLKRLQIARLKVEKHLGKLAPGWTRKVTVELNGDFEVRYKLVGNQGLAP